ncbi:phosphatidylinositol kinase [Micractinium conductrix]|uniref:Phosphatidylinositol kinase n=1 Tax=Micractinium conductrix TaxID=554055 RepID=A0A2P6V7U9_9CHLO|nr:phosphatidylinositol kinase [Micractinium conductrix]|eukprot:PSC70153.1 phosphatidylinositol kinase [Micractinium conductrix]
MMSGLDWGPPPPADGLEAAALEQLGGAPHSHAHYDAAGAGDGASWQQAGGTGAGSLSLPSVDVFEGLESGEPVPVPRYHQPPSVSQATLSCSMQHPGSICCSKLSSALDPGGAACTISLHTTARCTADDATVRRHLQPEELRALAAHALVGAAHAFSQAATAEYRSKTAPLQDVVAAHARLLHVLEHGVVICAERMPTSQFDHKSYLLTLQDPATARRVRAIYKPRVYGDADGWHRTPMEFVAYRLNLLLGLDLVPPTAYRSAPLTLSLGGEEDELCFQEGAMMLWVEDCKLLKEYPPHEWGVDPAVLLSDTRVLDVLLHNSDRHHGHFLLGPHWAKGRRHGSHWEGQPHPVLIDHAAAFRKEAFVSMDHENAFGSGPVRCVSASTYLRLRFLDSHTIAEELGAHLSRSEQRQLLHRRDYVLHYLDDLVASQGYGATVRE